MRLEITTKLKRYKIVAYIISIIFLPIKLPMILLIKLGEITEDLFNIIDTFGFKIIDKIADVFKFEEIAKNQYKNNKEKFS